HGQWPVKKIEFIWILATNHWPLRKKESPVSDESVLDHGWIPEEHAPDPVIGHGDPTPPGKVAIWMFLASEIMFFIAILGTYILLRSGSPALFGKVACARNEWREGTKHGGRRRP